MTGASKSALRCQHGYGRLLVKLGSRVVVETHVVSVLQ